MAESNYSLNILAQNRKAFARQMPNISKGAGAVLAKSDKLCESGL
jgi:hypothetical protein